MIIGIGCDIVDIRRIEKLYNNYQDRFLTRCFAPCEYGKLSKLHTYQKKSSFLSKRFAAKEAFVKALGTGINFSISWRDMTIHKKNSGQPYIEINQNIVTYLRKQNTKHSDFQIDLSMSDEYPYAQAFVIISGK